MDPSSDGDSRTGIVHTTDHIAELHRDSDTHGDS